MKNYISLVLNISLLILYTQLFSSCKKQQEPTPIVNVTTPAPIVNVTTPGTPAPPIQADIDGNTYSAQSLTALTGYASWFNASSPFPVASNGSYTAFTFKSNDYTYYGFPYSLMVSQVNISNRDTLFYEINIYSSAPIVPGSYQIWADTFYTYNPPVDVNTFATADAFSTLNASYGDSTTVGTITVSKLDLINLEASGSFSFINYGYSYNGVVPYTAVSKGTFTDLKFQAF